MLYFTGDTHGEIGRFSEEKMPGESKWGSGDVLFVCGDFGYMLLNNEKEKKYLDFLESNKPYTIAFIDGNHDNFTELNKYPCETWNGGKIHRIRKNIVHLMRGQVFEIQGKKIFTMGGAYSIDRASRALGVSYWEEELPNNDEYNEATKNLKANGMAVDYIVTHTIPQEIIIRLGERPDRHDFELTGFLEWIMKDVKFEKWFFGHWHKDILVLERDYERFYGLFHSVVKGW